MKTAIVSATALLLPMLLAPSPASAVEHTFKMNGSICQPNLAGRDRVNYSQWGISNNATTATTVVCPIVTEMFDLFVYEVVSIGVTFYDRHRTDDIRCTARAVTMTGAVAWEAEMNSSGGGPGSGPQTAERLVPNFEVANYLYTVTCLLPASQEGANSHISRIEVISVAQ
jgi:hypothetical protein